MGWFAAMAITAVFLAIEALPVVLGTGEGAILDWGFTYVTFRFILLPVACLLHLMINLGLFLLWPYRSMAERFTQLASILVPVAFLTFSYFAPWPLFHHFL